SFDNKILGTPVIDLNNDTLNMVSTDAEGVLAGGSTAIDGAVPNEQYYDLDLTIGDAGAYGGSYTLTNFFPIHTGSTRVYIIKSPFVVNSGNNINFNAESYDR
ncbi:MAG: hypothetical protein MI922_26720, partial [Bacteroidales bacterium]|nr:hypothetical protein [Bacteroidales bacterium]